MDRLLSIITSRYQIKAVISDSEIHVIPAAFLRSKLGLGGQNLKSAYAFRNKKLMSEYLFGATSFRLPLSLPGSDKRRIEDLFRSNDKIVIKPQDDTASRGVQILSKENVQCVYESISPESLIQEYIPHPVYHADGFIFQGKVHFFSVSRYLNTCHDYACGNYLGNEFVISRQTRKRFQIALTEMFSMLPTPMNTTFHVEFFYNYPNDELIFCEAASRTGGGFGAISKSIQFTYGIDLSRELFLSEVLPNYIPIKGVIRGDGLISGSVRIPNLFESKIDARFFSESWILYHNYDPTREGEFRLSLVFSLSQSESVTDVIQNILNRLGWKKSQ